MSTTGSSTLPSGLSSTHGTGSSLTAMSLAMSSDSIVKKRLRKTVAPIDGKELGASLARVSVPRRSRHFDRTTVGGGRRRSWWCRRRLWRDVMSLARV